MSEFRKILLKIEGLFLFQNLNDQKLNTKGIYIWVVPLNGVVRWVYYVGETGRSFSDRLRQHREDQLNGNYRIYDIAKFRSGIKQLIWNPYIRGAQRIPNVQQKFKAVFSENNIAKDYLNIFEIYTIPFIGSDRLRLRLESAIHQEFLNSKMNIQDDDVQYNPRIVSEEPIKVTFENTQAKRNLGLPEEIII